VRSRWTPQLEARAAKMRAKAEQVTTRAIQKVDKAVEREKVREQAENKRFGRVDRRVQPRSAIPSTWPAVEASCRIWGLPVRSVSTGFKTAYPPRVFENR